MTEQTVEKIKQFSIKYVKENLNEYEKVVIVALNDWHTPQLRNIMAYNDKVNPSACVNYYGTTFLHYASAKQDSMNENSIGPVNILIEAGANIFSQDVDGLVPYDYAKLKNNTVNQNLLKREFLRLKDRYENAKEIIGLINKGNYVVEGNENPENKRVISLKEYNHYNKNKETFEKNVLIWNGN